MEQAEGQSPSNPADRPLVTFDNNIVILLRNNDTDAQPARQLLALSRAGVIIAATTLSTALEKQRPDQKLGMHEYAAWLQEQGFTPGFIFTGPRTVGFHVAGTSPNTITFDVGLERALNERVHHILFHTVPFSWVEFRDREYQRLGILGTRRAALLELESLRWGQYIPPSPQAPATRPTPVLDTLEQMERDELWVICENLHRKWANRKNDALGFYAHLTQSFHTAHPEHSVFVTNDGKFHQKSKLAALRKLGFPGEILRPAEAVTFICKVTGTSLLQVEQEAPH
jgi:hypothetical protein